MFMLCALLILSYHFMSCFHLGSRLTLCALSVPCTFDQYALNAHSLWCLFILYYVEYVEAAKSVGLVIGQKLVKFCYAPKQAGLGWFHSKIVLLIFLYFINISVTKNLQNFYFLNNNRIF